MMVVAVMVVGVVVVGRIDDSLEGYVFPCLPTTELNLCFMHL